MERIDHRSHNHPQTPAGRKACRMQYREAKAQQDERDRVLKANYEAAHPQAEPFTKRGIVINFVMKDDSRYSVPFDRHGTNSELYRTALAYGWSAERTVNQAISEAISAVGSRHGFDNIKDYKVTEVD